MTQSEQIENYLATCGVGPNIPKEVARKLLEMMCESAHLRGQTAGLAKARELVKERQ
jgi:hypothetical protein